MRKLSLHICLFILPVILMAFVIQPNKKHVYASLKDDCANRANWMYQRVFKDSLAVDLAFIGSSRTMNSLNERLMEEVLPNQQLLNYAYCRYGRNLQYIFIRDLITQKSVHTIVLEVRAEENASSHPIFPYLAENEDLVTAYPFYNQHWLSDWGTAFQFRLQLLQEQAWQNGSGMDLDTHEYGFTPNYTIPDSKALEKHYEREVSESGSLEGQIKDTYPLHYLRRIKSLCDGNKVNLLLLYLPSYGVTVSPKNEDVYHQLGTLITPPPSILENPTYWADGNHLNPEGSVVLSRWLAQRLKKELH